MNLTENFANLKAKDVIEAAENRDLGLSAEFKTEVRFMRLIETISKSLPNSDGAAKKARGNIEALNHKFGDCTHFLTVTPDEENGIEIQAYSSVDIDISDTKKISEMSKKELQKKGILRKKISWQYPGFSAFYFLQVLDIINEVIVGWNFYEGRAFESGGYFGIPQAAMNTIEEQGRGRLHVHIGIWIKKIQQTLQQLFIDNNIQGKKVRKIESKKIILARAKEGNQSYLKY